MDDLRDASETLAAAREQLEVDPASSDLRALCERVTAVADALEPLAAAAHQELGGQTALPLLTLDPLQKLDEALAWTRTYLDEASTAEVAAQLLRAIESAQSAIELLERSERFRTP